MVCLDDAACAPDLHDVGEVDAPFVIAVCGVDYTHSLDVGAEAGGVDCHAEVFDEDFFFGGGGEGYFGGEERGVEDFIDVFAGSAVGGGDAEIVGCGESGGWYMESGCLFVGPDSGSFLSRHVLSYFVLYVGENVVTLLIPRLTDLSTNLDEKGIFLGSLAKEGKSVERGRTSSPSEFHFSNTFPISSNFIPICLFIIRNASLIALIIPLLSSAPILRISGRKSYCSMPLWIILT